MSDPGAGGGPPLSRVPPVTRTGAVRLTQVAGGQYVLSSNAQPVPPLSQVITNDLHHLLRLLVDHESNSVLFLLFTHIFF